MAFFTLIIKGTNKFTKKQIDRCLNNHLKDLAQFELFEIGNIGDVGKSG